VSDPVLGIIEDACPSVRPRDWRGLEQRLGPSRWTCSWDHRGRV